MTGRRTIHQYFQSIFYRRPVNHGLQNSLYVTRVYITIVVIILALAGLSTIFISDSNAQLNQDSATTKSDFEVLTTDTNKESSEATEMKERSSTNNESSVSVSSDETGSQVVINGQTSEAAPNESLQKTYVSDDGTTQVNVSIENSSTSTGDNDSSSQSMRLRLRSDTSSSTSTRSYSSSNVQNSE